MTIGLIYYLFEKMNKLKLIASNKHIDSFHVAQIIAMNYPKLDQGKTMFLFQYRQHNTTQLP